MSLELVLNLHGIGTPHAEVAADEEFFWVTRPALNMLLDGIVVAQTNSDIPIVITFDDGNLSDAEVALPELSKRGLTATFFICSGRIGAQHYLDKPAIDDLLKAGMKIGTHGKDHRNWRGLDDATLDAEVGTARKKIEDVCGVPVTQAAIPFGSYDRRVLRRLRQDSFEYVYTSDRGLAQSGAWLKPRDTMDRTWTDADVNRVLARDPSLKSRLRRDASMLYKSMR